MAINLISKGIKFHIMNLLLKVNPLSTIRNKKMNTQNAKLETAKLTVFVSNISSLPSVKAAICEIRVFDSRISPPLEHSARYFVW